MTGPVARRLERVEQAVEELARCPCCGDAPVLVLKVVSVEPEVERLCSECGAVREVIVIVTDAGPREFDL